MEDSLKIIEEQLGFKIENPITKFEIGMPCILKRSSLLLEDYVGRLVELSENEGSWGIFNGIKAFSVVYFATPHGTVVKTGLAFLADPNDNDLKRLDEYEEIAKQEDVWYADKIDENYEPVQTNK